MAEPRTLFDKGWDSHVVERLPDGTCILYIDRHLLHEVTSPQAFEGLRAAGRKVRRPDATLAVADHNVLCGARLGHVEVLTSKIQPPRGSLARSTGKFQARNRHTGRDPHRC